MSDLAERLSAVRARSQTDTPNDSWSALFQLADQMEREGREREEPRRAIFGLLGDRWSMLIMLVLESGTWRHATLKRLVSALSIEGTISQRILTLKLRHLERYGLIVRHSAGDAPKQVAYGLSELGRDLMRTVDVLAGWISQHRSELEAARLRFDPLKD